MQWIYALISSIFGRRGKLPLSDAEKAGIRRLAQQTLKETGEVADMIRKFRNPCSNVWGPIDACTQFAYSKYRVCEPARRALREIGNNRDLIAQGTCTKAIGDIEIALGNCTNWANAQLAELDPPVATESSAPAVS